MKLPKPKKVLTKVSLTDTGIMFEGVKVALLVPHNMGVPPKAMADRFQKEMNLLVERANRPSMYDIHQASLAIQKKMEERGDLN